MSTELPNPFLDQLYPLTDARHKPHLGTRKLMMLYPYGAPVPFLFRRYMKQTGAAGSWITVVFLCFTLIRVSCLHLG